VERKRDRDVKNSLAVVSKHVNFIMKKRNSTSATAGRQTSKNVPRNVVPTSGRARLIKIRSSKKLYHILQDDEKVDLVMNISTYIQDSHYAMGSHMVYAYNGYI